MSILHDLKDAPLKKMNALLIRDTDALDCILNMNSVYAATAAGENGAINVWKDVYGKYRAEAQRHYHTVDELKTDDFCELKTFVDKWLIKIGAKDG